MNANQDPMIEIKKYRSIDPYLRVPSSTVKDESIGWRALGILLYMLDLPEDWVFRLSHLSKRREGHGNGRSATSAALRELAAAGYLKIERIRLRGRLDGTRWHIAEHTIFKKPQEGSQSPPHSDFLIAEKPPSENRTLHRTDIKHDKSPTQRAAPKKNAPSSLCGVGVDQRQTKPDSNRTALPSSSVVAGRGYVVTPEFITYQVGNQRDMDNLVRIATYPSVLIVAAKKRAAARDDKGRAFASRVMRELLTPAGSQKPPPAWATSGMDVEIDGQPDVATHGWLDADYSEITYETA